LLVRTYKELLCSKNILREIIIFLPKETLGQQTIEFSMNQWQIDFGYAFSGF
jgi:hypothetical protein